jgi:hypothetical protein
LKTSSPPIERFLGGKPWHICVHFKLPIISN